MSEGISVIFVPGIRPKPPVADHEHQLRRCSHAGVVAAGGSGDEAKAIAQTLAVVPWSHGFYGEYGDVQKDLPGVERLLAGRDLPEDDVREAMGLKRRIGGWLCAVWDHLPLFAELLATPRMETRIKDVRRYFRNRDGCGSEARREVAALLREAWGRGDKVVLVGHSFGSVIAYDTLWELTHEHGNPDVIDLYITMGSPLTLNYMRTRLKGAHKRGVMRFPHSIRKWVNLAAVGEVTALDRKLGRCFLRIHKLGLTESITDNLNLVNQFHGPDGLNVHKCYGYFASPVTGRLLLDFYREQGAAPSGGDQ